MAINGLGTVSGAFATTAYADQAAGLQLISPTSIANSGGSASSSNGTITFTGVNSVSLNGVFSATYQNYLLNVSYVSASLNDYLGFRLRASSADNTTSNYSYGISEQNMDVSTLQARTYNSGVTFARIGYTGTIGNRAFATLHIGSPQQAQQTILNLQVTSGTKAMFGGAIFTATTQFDGFTLYSEAASTITGTVRVYGYKGA